MLLSVYIRNNSNPSECENSCPLVAKKKKHIQLADQRSLDSSVCLFDDLGEFLEIETMTSWFELILALGNYKIDSLKFGHDSDFFA